MEDLIKFTEYAESIGYKTDKMTFQEVVNLNCEIKKTIKEHFNPLSFIDDDLQEMMKA